MTRSLVFDSMGAMFNSLTSDRKGHLTAIAERFVRLNIPQDTSDALLAVLILEAAERQFVEDGGARPPPRESTIDILKPLFEAKIQGPKMESN